MGAAQTSTTGRWSRGMILASGARGRGFDSPLAPLFMTESYALVAQMVERKTLNLVVVGSIPTEGVFLDYSHESPL